ncbi:metal-dependent phosphoesterase [Paenibacillus darwinianus]|uniref:Metal-dependent phosphoesterase n=2 Tax=Paenibacillus darwinianus TaxID=1380763 RepID=A0A9W5RYM7_9BACL|nr:metal-dependent phosphoesterase [Paenibacillus darwinianus]EXX85234.1 metal-dependent phosphoesterase [Paenibacillus darwinianus]EXX85400.1 metal-dependent phosphoesterase [Paenibacillus darwinianus]
MNGRADLHTHTTASDGTGAPSDNVRLAKAGGLAAVAITDHDTVAGVAEAVAEGVRLGITVVPGVELSTVAEGRDIHILGYYFDLSDKVWLERLQSLRGVRGVRNEMIVERLRELGLQVSMREVFEQAGKDGEGDNTVGRPHIAAVLVAKGYVSTMKEAFDCYLSSGAAAYVNPPRITPFQAIDWIREAGGAAVVAHPGLYGSDRLIEELLRYGADGIEVFHSDHGPEEEARYGAMADRFGVVATGGSDYHGERNGVVFHGALGSRTVDASVIARLEGIRRARW